ncbi:MAG: hypothetical protein RLZZ522_485 [Verrucomicrobiota bacterium]
MRVLARAAGTVTALERERHVAAVGVVLPLAVAAVGVEHYPAMRVGQIGVEADAGFELAENLGMASALAGAGEGRAEIIGGDAVGVQLLRHRLGQQIGDVHHDLLSGMKRRRFHVG